MSAKSISAEATVYTSPAELFKDLPKDAFPKFGPKGVAQRAAARAWMQKNLIGRTIEWTAVVDNIEYGSRGEPTTMRLDFHNVTAQSNRLGETFPVGISGCSWGTIVLGDQAAHAIVGAAQRGPVGQGLIVYRSGPYYMLVYDHWTADEAKQALAWKQGQEVKLRSEITAADVCDGGTWTSEKIDQRGNGKTYPRIPLWIQVTLPSVNGLLPAALQPKVVRHGEPITSVTFSRDAKLMLVNNDLWDVGKFAKVRTLELPPLAEGEHRSRKVSDAAFHNAHIKEHLSTAATFSRDCVLLLHGVETAGMVVVWDMATQKELRRLESPPGFEATVTSVACSPNGKIAAAGLANHRIHLWDIETGKLVRVFRGHEAQVTSLAFSPDEKYLLSGSDDRTARLWGLRE